MVIVAKRKPRKWSGARLRELRERVGFTQTELAEAAEMYAADVSNYERDKAEPTFTVLVRLAAALGVGLEAFNPPAEGEQRTG